MTRAAVGWSLGKLKYVGAVHAAKCRARVACGAEKFVVEFRLLQGAHLCCKWENPVHKTVQIKRAEAVHMPVEVTTLTATVAPILKHILLPRDAQSFFVRLYKRYKSLRNNDRILSYFAFDSFFFPLSQQRYWGIGRFIVEVSR